MELQSSESRKRILLVLNPGSGGRRSNHPVFRDLSRYDKEFSLIRSLDKEETESFIRQNLDNYDLFVAAGGDGTVHSVAEELVGKDKILAVLPLGSGNGFANEFGFRKSVPSLLSWIKKAEYVEADAIEINNNLCLNVAGAGLDSLVAHSYNKLKSRGFISYIWLTLKIFITLRPIWATIRCGDEEPVSEKLYALTIANTRQFGNNAFIAPLARPDDGLINLVLVRPFPKIISPFIVFRLFTKKLNESRYVKHIATEKEIRISTDEKRFHIDGEPMEIKDDIVVRVKRKAIKVLKTEENKP